MTKSVGAQKEELKKKLEIQRQKDKELVKGIFRFHEVPGGQVKFPYKAYKNDQVEHYTLVDGETYTIPFGVARHLNTNCWYPQHAYQLDADGKPKMQIGRRVQRMSFQSLEFTDNSIEARPDLVVAKPL